MSDHATSAGQGDHRSLAELRRQADELLWQARAADPVVLETLRQWLPHLALRADREVAGTIQLADVQSAVARRLGQESWTALEALLAARDPVPAEAVRFLTALRDDDTAGADAVLARTPAVARYSIHTAAAVGDAETVSAMLANDPRLAVTPSPGDGVLPLIFAVDETFKRARGVPADTSLAIVRALLDAGADPNSAVSLPDGHGGVPALYFPCRYGHVAVARLLLERGANATDGEALYHAAQHDHRACLELLHAFGADLSRGPATVGNTPLHFLTAHTPENALTPAALRGLHWLLDHGADPAVASRGPHVPEPQWGETALHRAAAVGHDVTVLRALITHGAPVNASRDDGCTAYQLAVRGGHTTAAAWLAAAGANTTLRPVDALLAACAAGQADEAEQLVATTPGLIASLAPDDRDALGAAVVRNDLAAVRLMVRLGWPLDHDGAWGGTPLHWAAWNGRTTMVTLLLAAGAPVNQRDQRYGSSPLAWCCHGSRSCDTANADEYPAIIHALLDAGATRAEAFNRWHESPESLAGPSVVAALRARGWG